LFLVFIGYYSQQRSKTLSTILFGFIGYFMVICRLCPLLILGYAWKIAENYLWISTVFGSRG
jgi:hypothetical protein